MKELWIASFLLASTAGLAIAGLQGSGGKPPGAKAASAGGDCPATALIEKWEQATTQLASLPAATRDAIAQAHATLAASCPVCQEAPASFAFLGRFFDATVALDSLALAACEKSGQKCDAPEDIQNAFAERMAIGAKARELYAAFTRSMAPAEESHCAETTGTAKTSGSPGPELTFAGAGQDFGSISEEARRLRSTWSGIPARAAALPAGTKAGLFEAMKVLDQVPTCDLAKETMAVLGDGLERLVVLDTLLGAHFKAAGAAPKNAEHEQATQAFETRAVATAQVAELVHVMQKTMTPEIFQERTTTAMAGSAQ